MRKFLSILMLACLLCGLALPAGAEGELQLYAKVGESNEFVTEPQMPTDGGLNVRFYTAANNDTLITTSGNFFVPDGFLLDGPNENNVFHVTVDEAYKHKNITLTYYDDGKEYTITFMGAPRPVTPVTSLEIPADKLGMLAGDSDTFVDYLKENGYSGSGDFTIILPAENLGSISCKVQLPGDATLTIKGASGKTVTDFTIGAKNICLDGITFTGSPSVTANVSCAVSNCKFNASGDAFQLKQGQQLALSGNTYYNNASSFTLKVPGTKTEMWNVTVPKGATEVDGSMFQVSPVPAEKAMEYNFSSGIMSLLDNGWSIKYTADWPYTKCYVVRDGIAIASVTPTGKSGIPFNVTGQKYYFVEGELPNVTKVDASTKTVKIDETQSKYLGKVSFACGFTAAKVTDGKGNSVYSYLDSDGKLTFNVKKDTADTYTIKEVSTTKTVTKSTTTTSRSYNYKYQDYYLITPQRVTDCMRYAKDNLVTIECKEAGRRSISLPVASMAAAAEKGYSILLKNEKIADITMDPAALKSMAQQAKGTTVLLHYRSLNHKTLTTVGLASVQSHLDQFPNDNADLAFLLTATSDSETIEDLQLGTITLKIPFIVLPGTEEMKNEVYALQSETAASARETTVADGHLTTRLTDLTEHMVFQIGEPVETTEETTEPTVETTVETTQPETQPETVPETTLAPEPVEEEKGFPIWIPIVAVLLLGGGGAAAWFLYFRKRFKK